VYNKNGKPNNQYNWPLIIKAVKDMLPGWKARGVRPIIRQVFYQLVSKNMLPNIKSASGKLSYHLVMERVAGNIPGGTFVDVGRSTRESYLDYHTPVEYIQYHYDVLKNYMCRYQIPRWYKQPHLVEVWLEKEGLVDTFKAFLQGKEVNVRKNKCYNGWEAAANTFRWMYRIMHLEGVRKQIHILYFGDQDPSGEEILQALKDQSMYFANRYDLGRIEIRKLAVDMQQIDKYNLPSDPDVSIENKLLGTSIAKGDAKDKKGDSNTAKYIEKYKHLIKPGALLPPIAEIDAMVSTEQLLQVTQRLVTDEVDMYFDERVYQEQLEKHTQERIKSVAKEAVKLLRKHLQEY